MTVAFMNKGKKVLFDHSDGDAVDLLAANIRAALMKVSYSPDIDSHDHWDDSGVSSAEIVATGYVADGDGRNLATKTMTRVDANDRIQFDADNLTFPSIGGAVNDIFDTILLMKWTGTPSTSPMLAYMEVASTATVGGDVTLTWDADGILHFT